MSLYKDIPDAQKSAFVEIINRRLGQLNGLERDWSDKAVKYLFVTNSGGAVALLNFISGNESWWAGFSLACFLLGLIFVGLLTAFVYQDIESIYKNYRIDVESNFFQNKITWAKLQENDNERRKSKWFEKFFGWGAFLLFIAGTILGVAGLLISK